MRDDEAPAMAASAQPRPGYGPLSPRPAVCACWPWPASIRRR